MVWDEGGLAAAFRELFHLLRLLIARWWSEGKGRELERPGPQIILGLSGEKSDMPRVCMHLEVGFKLDPARDARHRWHCIRLVGCHHLCQVLIDVLQVLVVHLSCHGLTKRFCPLDRKRLEVLLVMGWESIWIAVQKWDVWPEAAFVHRTDYCFYGCHERCYQCPP